MPTDTEVRTDRISGSKVEITKTRGCVNQPWPGHGEWCTPWARTGAHIHMSPTTASAMATNEDNSARAVAGLLSLCGCGVASGIVALSALVFKLGYEHTKTPDGGLDIYLSNTGATAGRSHTPVLLDPTTCGVILQSL